MIYTNGVELTEWRMDGESDWTKRVLSFAGGENTIRWCYFKDESESYGEDCAWVDCLTWTATTIPELPQTATPEQIAAAFEGFADTRFVANITTGTDYAAYRTWAMGLSNVTLLQLKKSPNAWISYALDTDKLIEGEVSESRLKISSFEQEIEKEICSVKLHIDGVDIGNDATVENLLRVFAIEGAPELDSNLFSVTNVVLTLAQPCEGSVEFVLTTKKRDSFFFRARMRYDSNDIGKNKFEEK
jgi:hypothetical protein